MNNKDIQLLAEQYEAMHGNNSQPDSEEDSQPGYPAKSAHKLDHMEALLVLDAVLETVESGYSPKSTRVIQKLRSGLIDWMIHGSGFGGKEDFEPARKAAVAKFAKIKG